MEFWSATIRAIKCVSAVAFSRKANISRWVETEDIIADSLRLKIIPGFDTDATNTLRSVDAQVASGELTSVNLIRATTSRRWKIKPL